MKMSCFDNRKACLMGIEHGVVGHLTCNINVSNSRCIRPEILAAATEKSNSFYGILTLDIINSFTAEYILNFFDKSIKGYFFNFSDPAHFTERHNLFKTESR